MATGQLGLNASGMANLASMAALGPVPEDEEELVSTASPPLSPTMSTPPPLDPTEFALGGMAEPMPPSPVMEGTVPPYQSTAPELTQQRLIELAGQGFTPSQPMTQPVYPTDIPGQALFAPRDLPGGPVTEGQVDQFYQQQLDAQPRVAPRTLPGVLQLARESVLPEALRGKPQPLKPVLDAAGDEIPPERLARWELESDKITQARLAKAREIGEKIKNMGEAAETLSTFEADPSAPHVLQKPTGAEIAAMAEKIGPTAYTDALVKAEEDIEKLKWETLFAARVRDEIQGLEDPRGILNALVRLMDDELNQYPFASLSFEPLNGAKWRTIVAEAKQGGLKDDSVLFGRALSFWRELVKKPQDEWRVEVAKSFGLHPLGKYLNVPSMSEDGSGVSSVLNYLADVKTSSVMMPFYKEDGSFGGYRPSLVVEPDANPTDLLNKILANGNEAYKRLLEKGVEVAYHISHPPNVLDPSKVGPQRITFEKARSLPPLPGLLHLAKARYGLEGPLSDVAKHPLLQSVMHDYNTIAKDPNPNRKMAAQQNIMQWLRGLFTTKAVYSDLQGWRHEPLGAEIHGDLRGSYARWVEFMGTMVPIRNSAWDGITWFTPSGHMYLPLPDEVYDSAISLVKVSLMRAVKDDPHLIEGLRDLRLDGGSYMDVLQFLEKDEITRIVGNFPLSVETMRTFDRLGYVDIATLDLPVVDQLKKAQDYLRAEPKEVLNMKYRDTFLQMIDGIRALDNKNKLSSPARKLAVYRAAARTTPDDFDTIDMLQSWADTLGSVAYHALLGIVTLGKEGILTTSDMLVGHTEGALSYIPRIGGYIMDFAGGGENNLFHSWADNMQEDAVARLNHQNERLARVPEMAKAVLSHYAAYGDPGVLLGRLKYQMPLVMFDALGAFDVVVNAPRYIGPTLAKPMQIVGGLAERAGGPVVVRRRGKAADQLGKYEEIATVDFGTLQGIGVKISGYGDRIGSITYKNPHWYGRGLKSLWERGRSRYIEKALDGSPTGRMLSYGMTRVDRLGDLVKIIVEEARMHSKVTSAWSHQQIVEGLSRMHIHDVHVPFREVFRQLTETLKTGSTYGPRPTSIPLNMAMLDDTTTWMRGLFTKAEKMEAELVTLQSGPRLKLSMLDIDGNRVPVTYSELFKRVKMFEDVVVRDMVTGPMAKHVRFWLKYPDDPMTIKQLSDAKFLEKFNKKLKRYGKESLTWLVDNAESLEALKEGRARNINQAIWKNVQDRIRHLPNGRNLELIQEDIVRIPMGNKLVSVRAQDYVEALLRVGRVYDDAGKLNPWGTVTKRIISSWIKDGNIPDAKKLKLKIGQYNIDVVELGLVKKVGQDRFMPSKLFMKILRDRGELTAMVPEGVTMASFHTRIDTLRRLITAAADSGNGVVFHHMGDANGVGGSVFDVRLATPKVKRRATDGVISSITDKTSVVGRNGYGELRRTMKDLGIEESAVFSNPESAQVSLNASGSAIRAPHPGYVKYLENMLDVGDGGLIAERTGNGQHFVLRHAKGERKGRLVSVKEVEKAASNSYTAKAVQLIIEANPRLGNPGVAKLLAVLAGGPAPRGTRSSLVKRLRSQARKSGMEDDFVDWLGNQKRREANLLPPDAIEAAEFTLNKETGSFSFDKFGSGATAFDTTEHALGRIIREAGRTEEAVQALENLHNAMTREKILSVEQKIRKKRFSRATALKSPLVAIEAAFLQLTPEAQFAFEAYMSSGVLPKILTDPVSIKKGYAAAIFKQWEEAGLWKPGADGSMVSGGLTDFGVASSFVAHDMSQMWYKTLPHRVIQDVVPTFNGTANAFYDIKNILPEELHGLAGAMESQIDDIRGKLGHLIANHANAGLIDDIKLYDLWNYVTEVWTSNFDELVQATDPLRERVITPVMPKRITAEGGREGREAARARVEPVFKDWHRAALSTFFLLEARLNRVRMLHGWMKQGDIVPAVGKSPRGAGEMIAPGAPGEFIRLDAMDHRIPETLGRLHFGENWGKQEWFIRRDKLDVLRLHNNIMNQKGIGFKDTRWGFDYVYHGIKALRTRKAAKEELITITGLAKATDLDTAERVAAVVNSIVGGRSNVRPMMRTMWDVLADTLNFAVHSGSIVGETLNNFALTQWWKINKLFRGGFAPIMRNIWTNVALTASQNPKAFLDPKYWDDMGEFVKDVANGNLSKDLVMRDFQEFALGWMNLEGAATGGASGIGRDISAGAARHSRVGGRTAQKLDLSISAEAADDLIRHFQEAKQMVKVRELDDINAVLQIMLGEDGIGGLMGTYTRAMSKPGEVGRAINDRLSGAKGPVGSSFAVFNDLMAYITNVGRGAITGGDRFTKFFATWFNLGDGMFKYPLAKKLWFEKGPGALHMKGVTKEVKKWYKDRGLTVEEKWWRNPSLANDLGYLSPADVYTYVTHFLPDYSRANEWVRGARLIDPFAYFQWKVMWGQFQFGMRHPAYSSLVNEMGGWLNAQQFDSPAEQYAYFYMRPEMRNRVADTPMGDYSFQYMNLNPDSSRMTDHGSWPHARAIQTIWGLGSSLWNLLSGDPDGARSAVLQASHEFTDHFFGPSQVNLGQLTYYAMNPALLNETSMTSVDWLYKALRQSGGSTIQKAGSAGLGVPHVPRYKTAPYNTKIEAETWKNVLASWVLGLAAVPDPVKRGTQGWNRNMQRLKAADESIQKDLEVLPGWEKTRHNIYQEDYPPNPYAVLKSGEAVGRAKKLGAMPLGPDVPMTEEMVRLLKLRQGTAPQLLGYMPPPYRTMEGMTNIDPRAATLPIYLNWLIQDQHPSQVPPPPGAFD